MPDTDVARQEEVDFVDLVKKLVAIVPATQAQLMPENLTCREARLTVKLALTTRVETDMGGKVGVKLWAATLDATYSRKYAYTAESAATLDLLIVPVPPPSLPASPVEVPPVPPAGEAAARG